MRESERRSSSRLHRVRYSRASGGWSSVGGSSKNVLGGRWTRSSCSSSCSSELGKRFSWRLAWRRLCLIGRRRRRLHSVFHAPK